MGESRLPGPVCNLLKDQGWMDSGTQCRKASSPPGPEFGPEAARRRSLEIVKQAYLDHAREVSYAMQGKVLGEKGIDAVNQLLGDFGLKKPSKPARVQSFLGGKFLRMYLDGEVDPDAVEAAGQEIAAAPTFASLTRSVDSRIAKMAAASKRLPTEEELAARALKYLSYKREHGGIAFKQTLNPVIGGVSGVAVSKAVILSQEPTPKGTRVEYEIHVIFKDTYDFENERSGVYDRYRKELADHLQKDEFSQFDKKYYGAITGWDGYEQPQLDNAALFASFMYALEKKGWTPGPLAWEVTVPMRGSFTHKGKSAPKSKGKPKK